MEEENGNSHGIEMSRNAPAIFHLLYTDDLIITCRATVTEAEVVKRCFENIVGGLSKKRILRNLVYCFPKILTDKSRGK